MRQSSNGIPDCGMHVREHAPRLRSSMLPSRSPLSPSSGFFVSQMKIPSPRTLSPFNCFFAHACLPLVSHFCQFSYFLTFKRKLGLLKREERKEAIFVFSKVAFYHPKLCAVSYSVPLILSSFFTSSDFVFHDPPSSPICSTTRRF